MLEKQLEQQLKTAVEQHGGLCWKFTSPGTAGVPDRIIILPGGHIGFVELKRPGAKPRPLQQHRHQQLQQLGAASHTLDNPNNIQDIINAIQTA